MVEKTEVINFNVPEGRKQQGGRVALHCKSLSLSFVQNTNYAAMNRKIKNTQFDRKSLFKSFQLNVTLSDKPQRLNSRHDLHRVINNNGFHLTGNTSESI